MPRYSGPLISVSKLAQVIIWHNKDLLMGSKPFFFVDWAAAGIYYLGQFFEPDGSFMTIAAFHARYGRISNSDWLRFAQLKECIPAEWMRTFIAAPHELVDFSYVVPPVPRFFDHRTLSYHELSGTRSKVLYSIFVHSTYSPPRPPGHGIETLA